VTPFVNALRTGFNVVVQQKIRSGDAEVATVEAQHRVAQRDLHVAR
jgi:hypothetical protein